MPFRVNSILAGNVATLCCQGNLGCDEAPVLSGAVMPLLCQKRTVLLNFAGVGRLDSGGLGTLVLLQMYARSAGGVLCFCNLNRYVRELMELTQVDTFFDICASERQAGGESATLPAEIHQ